MTAGGRKKLGRAIERADEELDRLAEVTERDFDVAVEEEATPEMRRHVEAEPDEEHAA